MPNDADRNVSGKIRSIDNEKAGVFAARFGSTRVEVISAWRTLFEQAPLQDQRKAIERVRKLHPMPYPRTGRGNRKLAS